MATEKRLIYVNALIERIKKRLKNEMIIGWLCSIVDEAPTVDAVEVVHARWLYDSDSERHFCSACDMYAIERLHRDLDGSEYYEVYLTNYCPNCGAKMAGDGNG